MGRETLFKDTLYRFAVIGAIILYSLYEKNNPEAYRYINRIDEEAIALDFEEQSRLLDERQRNYSDARRRREQGYDVKDFKRPGLKELREYLAKKNNTSSNLENQN